MRLVVLLILFFAIQAKGQEYTILHLKGKINRVSNNQPLKPGEKISEEEKIAFVSKDAMAAVLSSTKGRYIIKPNQNDSEKLSDLVYVLKSTIAPVRGGMSTRAAGIQNALDLKLYFAELPYVWAGEEIRIEVSGVAFPMNENRFFFIRYDYNGEMINKMLGHNKEDLILNKKSLFNVDGTPIDPNLASNFTLHYYKVVNEESTLITAIDFVLIDDLILKTLFDQMKDEGEDAFYHIADIFSDLYGKCDPMQVRYNLVNRQ